MDHGYRQFLINKARQYGNKKLGWGKGDLEEPKRQQDIVGE